MTKSLITYQSHNFTLRNDRNHIYIYIYIYKHLIRNGKYLKVKYKEMTKKKTMWNKRKGQKKTRRQQRKKRIKQGKNEKKKK